ncbi:VCBS repeat-containing protein [Chitinophaga silvatica]|uniref:VCBS repeat-containing protein n=1 Tax=Chitinophaga silvatica TaxID=2282649 RepID=A0A3E1Y627_9BACT|nr:VCBS repeat-containing protein [Chitinophaga silvatica]RFS20196.1 VCBS repeat-containing protein [Chitinophaga silvatica]
MKKYLLPIIPLCSAISLNAQNSTQGVMKFEKQIISAESYESVAVFDVNNDGKLDLVSGAYWYEGPAFFRRHYIGPVKQYGEYWDDFSTIPFDVNNDGKVDIITGGWFGKTLVWKENPGGDKEWKIHEIATPGNIETTRAFDLDGDGVVEIIPNTPNDPLIIYKHDSTSQTFIPIKISDRKSGHGLGFGDINGDGRTDIVVPEGWFEAPKKPFEEKWTFHAAFNLGTVSVPVIVADVNNDGLNDLIVGQGHDYGLDWYEQRKNNKTGNSSWIRHAIDPYNSQYHTMLWEDIDNDGAPELITGKRYRAHNDHDPGSADLCGIYYFKWNKESFSKQIVSYGTKGVGLYFVTADLTGSGRKDIIVAGKDGLCVFYNKGNR